MSGLFSIVIHWMRHILTAQRRFYLPGKEMTNSGFASSVRLIPATRKRVRHGWTVRAAEQKCQSCFPFGYIGGDTLGLGSD